MTEVCECGALITQSPVDGAWEDESGACGCGDGEHQPSDFKCEGHPAGPYDPMGQTVYCDGSCR